MTKYLKTAIVLCLICAASAVLLAFANKVTEPVISEYERQIVIKALEEVSCGYSFDEQVKVDDVQYVSGRYALTEKSVVKGYILNIVTKGYGGEMTLAASYDTDGKILAVKMVSNSETPGVGKKSENEGYMDKFIGTGTERPVPVSKSMLTSAESAVVSGATITFGGISRALEAGSAYVKTLGGAL